MVVAVILTLLFFLSAGILVVDFVLSRLRVSTRNKLFISIGVLAVAAFGLLQDRAFITEQLWMIGVGAAAIWVYLHFKKYVFPAFASILLIVIAAYITKELIFITDNFIWFFIGGYFIGFYLYQHHLVQWFQERN